MTDRTRFDGIHVLVTGAGSGIGRASALLAAARGAKVTCLDLKAADQTSAEIERAGGDAVAVGFDVTDSDWEGALREARERFGPVRALASCAGILSRVKDTVEEQTPSEWQRVHDVNVGGTWGAVRAVLPGMLAEGGGAVVTVASVAAMIGMNNLFTYAATKGAVQALSRQVANQYGDRGIRVNTVLPGSIATPLNKTAPGRSPDAKPRTDDIPMGRLGEADEVAEPIVFLLSDASSYIIGQSIVVDGGWTIH